MSEPLCSLRRVVQQGIPLPMHDLRLTGPLPEALAAGRAAGRDLATSVDDLSPLEDASGPGHVTALSDDA